MLSDREQAMFDDIARRLGPLRPEGERWYLMPWFLPPAMAAFYATVLMAASVALRQPPLAVVGYLALIGASFWALHRRTRAGGPPVDLTTTPPWIEW
jgi:hypothetical protein